MEGALNGKNTVTAFNELSNGVKIIPSLENLRTHGSLLSGSSFSIKDENIFSKEMKIIRQTNKRLIGNGTFPSLDHPPPTVWRPKNKVMSEKIFFDDFDQDRMHRSTLMHIYKFLLSLDRSELMCEHPLSNKEITSD